VSAPTGRLLLATITLLTASAVAGWLILATASRGYSDELTQRLNRNIAMYVVAEAPLISGGRVDEAQLTRLAHQAMVINPIAEVYLLDPGGRIIGSRGDTPPTRQAVDVSRIRTFLSGAARGPVYGSDPRNASIPRIFSAAEIVDGSQLQGYVYVVLGGTASQSVAATLAESHILRAAVLTSLIVLLLAAMAAWALTAWLSRPLHRLHSRVVQLRQQYAAGELTGTAAQPIDLDVLSKAIEALAGSLAAQVSSLEQADRMRRDLYASISHDLRTPLTAMRGYLDTLACRDRHLSPERQREFIAIAVRHCERLTRLVDQVFSLARLDTTTVRLHREPLALTELAQDIVSKYQGLAESGRTRLHLEIDTEAPAVLADIGMLETVLQNLLDNALRHTQAGGEIIVSVKARTGGVEVSVSDTGTGIAPSDLERLQLPYEVGAGGRTGFGLAIVSRVLRLHGSALHLQSAVDSGTRAMFTLAAASADAGAIDAGAFSARRREDVVMN
jgi:signal transduction histidine kinase